MNERLYHLKRGRKEKSSGASPACHSLAGLEPLGDSHEETDDNSHEESDGNSNGAHDN